MATWRQFVTAEPELAREVAAAFAIRKHCTVATVRADGAPRISGTEVTFTDDDVYLGMMPGSRKGRDVRADPRVAVHSPTVDPQSPASWAGEAKFSGRAVPAAAPSISEGADSAGEVPEPPEAEWYRVDLTSVVFTGLTPDSTMLRIRLWRPEEGLETMTRK